MSRGSRGRVTRVRGRGGVRLAPRGPQWGPPGGGGSFVPGAPPDQEDERQSADPKDAPTPGADSAPGRLGGSQSRSRGSTRAVPTCCRSAAARLCSPAGRGAGGDSGRSRGTSPVYVTAAWRRPAWTPREGRPSAPRRRGHRRGLCLLARSVPLRRALRPAPQPRHPLALGWEPRRAAPSRPSMSHSVRARFPLPGLDGSPTGSRSDPRRPPRPKPRPLTGERAHPGAPHAAKCPRTPWGSRLSAQLWGFAGLPGQAPWDLRPHPNLGADTRPGPPTPSPRCLGDLGQGLRPL